MADVAEKEPTYKGKPYSKLTTDDVAGQQFIVTGAYVLARTGTAEGTQWRGFLRNSPLPVDVAPEHMLHLLQHGLIGTEAVLPPTPMELAGQGADGGADEIPPPAAPKDTKAGSSHGASSASGSHGASGVSGKGSGSS